ncbi:unnamed protein product [Orchesella dallaii]|uniref:Nucleosome assembly protein 1-like 1 n=1 Tax=Orchesella dallaii TaxID=48710 RepID=A0ABP1PNT3_9HEXA
MKIKGRKSRSHESLKMSTPVDNVPTGDQVGIAVQDEVKAEEVIIKGVQGDVPQTQKPLWNLKFGESEIIIPDSPPEVERRVKALKKLQVELTDIERKFFQEVHELETKYAPLYNKFYERRHAITTGKYEPTDEECEAIWETESESESEVKKKEESKLGAVGGAEEKADPSAKAVDPVSGVPEFWLHVLRNVDRLSEMVHDADELVLKHLTDITMEVTNEPMGFKLLFHFSPNEYFSNSVLIKSYEMKCEVDPRDPFGFEGPEIINCTGCTIDWKEGKNVTIRAVQKKQRHKKSGTLRFVNKEESVPSFFTFFAPPQLPKEGTDDDDVRMEMTGDFEIGQYIRERIIPRAVLYYTGEALDYDTTDQDDDDDDDDDDEEEEDDDADSHSRTTAEDEEDGNEA